MVKLTFYGGVNEIGGNKVLLEDGDTRLFFDFGISFAKRYRYFEEYLKPRAGAGLLDLLELGLLPPLQGLYREDLTCGADLWLRFEPIASLAEVDGVLVSHAHLDHSGYISFLRPEIPIYTTAMTSFIAKAIQDSGKGDFEKEVCYAIPKEEKEGVFQSAHWKAEAAQQRGFKVLDPEALTSDALAFWQRTPGRRGLETQQLLSAGNKIGSLCLRHFPVDHSIYGATAFAVETSSGWVVYTGDLRLHGEKGHLTRKFIEEAARLEPTLLICEGTNVESSAGVSEDEVYTNARRAVENARALVIADFGPRNIERLLTFRRIAEETKRRLVILAKDAYLLKAMRFVSPEVPDAKNEAIAVYKDAKAKLDGWETEVRKQYHNKLVTPEEIRQGQDSYILCFSFFDINELPSLMPRAGSIYLYSSSEAHNEEQEMDFWRLHNWLGRFQMTGVGLPVEVEPSKWEIPEGEHGLHASGHATGRELLELIQQIRPRILIPIHTEKPEYFQQLERTGIKVQIPEEGETLSFP
jgi:ribonuclease J